MAVATDLKLRAEQTLREVLERYSSGEGAVVRVFFSKPRTNDEYLEAVLRQIGREVQVAHGLERLGPMGDQLERGVGRWELYGKVEQIADELKHHALLADLAEWLVGRKLSAEELRKYEVNAIWEQGVDGYYLANPHLPEAARMVEVTRELMATTPQHIWKGITKVSEGGGGQAFVEASRVSADEFQRRFATVMGEIVEDELQHGPEQLKGFVEQQVNSPEDLELAREGLTAIMAQHLRVRNEIYGYPLSE
ncbi:MAG TPA: hypothetical protein VKU60_15590, partial [Chloroflexota bacterium]|nr:hypothetical protein [Chloroflexota bacterium]